MDVIRTQVILIKWFKGRSDVLSTGCASEEWKCQGLVLQLPPLQITPQDRGRWEEGASHCHFGKGYTNSTSLIKYSGIVPMHLAVLPFFKRYLLESIELLLPVISQLGCNIKTTSIRIRFFREKKMHGNSLVFIEYYNAFKCRGSVRIVGCFISQI